jgi:hypothetical protein
LPFASLSTWTLHPAMTVAKVVPTKTQIAVRFINLPSQTVIRYQALVGSM